MGEPAERFGRIRQAMKAYRRPTAKFHHNQAHKSADLPSERRGRMPKTVIVGIAGLALIASSPAPAQTPAVPAPVVRATPPAASPVLLSSKSSIKDLTTDPKAKEALTRHIPQVAAFLLSGQAQALFPDSTTLEELARVPQAQQAGLTAEALRKIDEDLAK